MGLGVAVVAAQQVQVCLLYTSRYKEKQDLARVLEQLRAEGMSILLVEHDMDFVMRLTNHLVVMDFGTKLAEGLSLIHI